MMKRIIMILAFLAAILSSTESYCSGYLCDVAVVGGTPAGIAAALQSARMGVGTCLIEETKWLGGQLLAIGSFDGGLGTGNNNGIFGEFKRQIHDHYGGWGAADTCLVSDTCFEAKAAHGVFVNMIDNTPNLALFLNTRVAGVNRSGSTVTGLRIQPPSQGEITIDTHVVIDAGMFGDVLAMSGADFEVGIDADSNEPSAGKAYVAGVTGLQPPTYTMVLKNYGSDVSIPAPKGYYGWRYDDWTLGGLWGWGNDNPLDPQNWFRHYLNLPNGDIVINWPIYGNDYPGIDLITVPGDRPAAFDATKRHSLQFLHHLQINGHPNWSLSCTAFDTEDCFPPFPYVRESRRLVGTYQLREEDVILTDTSSMNEYTGKRFRSDAISYVDYSLDLHQVVPDPCLSEEGCNQSLLGSGLNGRSTGTSSGTGGFGRHDTIKASVPYGVLVPRGLDGLLAAEQNISVTHIANGITRLGPVCMRIGQAAGSAAALSVLRGTQLRDLNIEELQASLISQGHAVYYFSDLSALDVAFPFVQKVAQKKVMTGYRDDSFSAGDLVSRGQAAVFILRALNESPAENCNGAVFGDVNEVTVGAFFCRYIERLAALGITSGCSRDDPATAENEALFCPGDGLTRSEATALLAVALKETPPPCTGEVYGDVNVQGEGAFCGYIERLSSLEVVTGCGNGIFCPGNFITRGQMAQFLTKALIRR